MSYKTSCYFKTGSKSRYSKLNTEQKARWRKRTGCGQYSMHRWTTSERLLILISDETDRELSGQLHRSVVSIQQQRHNLKRKYGDNAITVLKISLNSLSKE